MRKVWFIAIMAVCVALGTGCGSFQAAGEPDPEETVSVAEKSGAGEDTPQEDAMPGVVETGDIFSGISVYETDNGFAVYRTNDREMDCDYEGDYLAIQDLESGDIIYLPDSYDRILDVKVESGGVQVRYADREETEIREERIPICFSAREESTDIYPHCEKKVLVQREEGLALELEELPRLVWRDNVKSGEESYELVFERVSPGYRKLFVEACQWLADYRLTVRDEAGQVIASQMIVNYPIPFEEAYWLEDFSGDGMADMAFCTEKTIGTGYIGSTLETFIWNEENRCYEHKQLPGISWDDAWPRSPSWNRAESVIIEPAGFRNKLEYWDMYAFVDGQWQRIRRLVPEYEIDEVGFSRAVGYREIFYQDGQAQEERYLEENDLEGSIWFDDEHMVDLDTFGSEWTSVSETIGGMTIDKEVRKAGRIESCYGAYEIAEFWPDIYYYRMYKYDCLPEQEADMLLGRVVDIGRYLLITYDSFRDLGSREGRLAFPGNYMIETVRIEDPAYQWERLDEASGWYEEKIGPGGSGAIFQEYGSKIYGKISIPIAMPFGEQEYYVMEDGIVMYSTLTCQYFYLRKLDTGERRSEPVPQLSDEEEKKLLQEIYGTYDVQAFLPTKFYPALDSGGDVLLPQGEADLMLEKEIIIEEDLFVTFDNHRLPNSQFLGRGMEDYLLEAEEIPSPDYQVQVKGRDEIYGLRDEMLPEELLQDSYVEISVYPGFGSDSEKILSQLYLLNDGRVILYAMGEYFLLRQN